MNKLSFYIKGIRDQFMIYKSDLLSSFACFLVFTLFAVIGCSIVYYNAFDNDGVFLVMYGIFNGFACLFTIILTTIFFSTHFPLGIQLSMSRSDLIIRLETMLLILHAGFLIVSRILYDVVVLVHSQFDSTLEKDLFHLPLWGWLLLLFAPLRAGTFAGAIIARFGKRGGWTLYAIFMGACFSTSFLPDSDHSTPFNEFPFVWNNTHSMILVVLVLLIFSFLSVKLLRKVSI